jgi:hypothetical protein
MQFYWLMLGVLAVWRVTHLLNAEDGPWDLVVRLRQRAGTGFWAGLLDCFYCLSLWIAMPAAYGIGSRWMERFLLWPALSAGAILLERLAPERATASSLYSEDQEYSHVLRQEPAAVTEAESLSNQPNPIRTWSGTGGTAFAERAAWTEFTGTAVDGVSSSTSAASACL